MAVVTKYSQAARDPSAGKTPKAYHTRASVRAMVGSIAVANGDSIASKFYIGKIASNARLLPSSTLRYTAITSGATNLGFDITDKGAVLVSAQSIASAGSSSAVAAVAVADLVKPLWQLAGYTQDPGTELDIVATLTAAAAAAGTLVVDLHFAV